LPQSFERNYFYINIVFFSAHILLVNCGGNSRRIVARSLPNLRQALQRARREAHFRVLFTFSKLPTILKTISFRSIAKVLAVVYLFSSLALAVIGFLLVFPSNQDELSCTFSYDFAFVSLLALNLIMDIWICYKICVVLHWAFLSED